ncbi:MAG TPA: exosortase-associated EpsI family protein [Chthoniobacterales bacterium]|jgi:hypothetical protein
MSGETALRDTHPRVSRPVVKYLAFGALAAVVFFICVWGPPPPEIEQPGVKMQLPATILGFAGKDQPISEGEKVMLPEDTEIVKKLYTGGAADSVNLQIVLSGADRRSIHRPEICLPGQGWRVRAGEVVKVPLKSGALMPVMVLDIARPSGPADKGRELNALYAYWFVSADRETPYHLERVLRTNLDLLLHNKANRWAYVIVMSPVLEGWAPGGRNRAETLKLIEDFIRESVPAFQYREMKASSPPAAGAGSTAAS